MIWSVCTASISLLMYLNQTTIEHIRPAGSQLLWLTWTLGSGYIGWSIMWGCMGGNGKSRWLWPVKKVWGHV